MIVANVRLIWVLKNPVPRQPARQEIVVHQISHIHPVTIKVIVVILVMQAQMTKQPIPTNVQGTIML